MKLLPLLILLAGCASPPRFTFTGRTDLTNFMWYASQPLPARITNADGTISSFDYTWYGDTNMILEFIKVRTERVK